MRLSKVASFVTLLVIMSASVYAQTSMSVDEAEVRKVVQYYVNGLTTNDVESIEKAFHPKARVFSVSDKYDLKEITLRDVESALKSNIRRHEPKLKELGVSMNIALLDVSSYAAMVKLEMVSSKREVLAFDYLSLENLGGEWKIVSSVRSVVNKPNQQAMREPLGMK